MNKTPMLLMLIMLALASVACNLNSSAGAPVQLTDTSQDLIPTATAIDDAEPTEISEPIATVTPIPTIIVPDNNQQIPPTAVLPPVTLPLIGGSNPPPANECGVTPTQSGGLVNVRRGADLGYEAFFQLKGYAVIMADVNGWYQIPLDGGFSGFVSSTVTKLVGDCTFLYPTPIPSPDPNHCYLNIPLVAGIDVFYYNEPQREGSQAQGKMATVRLEIEASKSGWYKVTNYEGKTGWIPQTMGSINGTCNNIPDSSPEYPICLIVANHEGSAYNTPFSGNDRFGTVPAGDALGATAKTISNWYGFDPGIAQAGNEGLDRLRWVYPNHTSVFHAVGDCNALEIVYDQDADWDIAISTAGEVPTDGCYIQSTAPVYTNYIYTGLENPQVVGVLNTYAPFVSLGDLGHVIELPNGEAGWVNRNRVQFVGDACPV